MTFPRWDHPSALSGSIVNQSAEKFKQKIRIFYKFVRKLRFFLQF